MIFQHSSFKTTACFTCCPTNCELLFKIIQECHDRNSHEWNLCVTYQSFPWATGSSNWLKISQLPTSSMHQVCYNFWIKGSQPELMSTLGACPFSLLLGSIDLCRWKRFLHSCVPQCCVWSKARFLPWAGPWRQSTAGEMPPPWCAALRGGQKHRRTPSLPPGSTAVKWGRICTYT